MTTAIVMIAKVAQPTMLEYRPFVLSFSIFLSLAILITKKRIGTVTTALITAASIKA
jgi:hypothetical protein